MGTGAVGAVGGAVMGGFIGETGNKDEKKKETPDPTEIG